MERLILARSRTFDWNEKMFFTNQRAITKIQSIIIAVIIIVAGVGGYFAYSTLTRPKVEEIRAGVLFPLTGAYAPFGEDCRKGVMLAIDTLNEEGGIQGVKIRAIVGDSQSDTKVAVSEAERLITVEKVHIVLGSYAGPLAMAIGGVTERNKTPFFELIAAPNELTLGKDNQYTFRFGPMGLYYGYVAVDFLKQYAIPKLGWDASKVKVAIVHEDGAYGASVAAGDEERAKELGLNVVIKEAYSSRATDLSALITKLKAANPDVLLVTSYAVDGQLFIRQSSELGFNPKLFIGHSAGYELPVTAGAVGDKIIGVLAVGFPVTAMNTKVLLPNVLKDRTTFLSRYAAKFGGIPASWGAKAFSAVYHALRDALNKAVTKYGDVSADSLRKAFLEVDIPKGGTFVGFGVKFLGSGTRAPGENERATLHPVCQWFNSTETGFVAVWPSDFALRDPVLPKPPW